MNLRQLAASSVMNSSLAVDVTYDDGTSTETVRAIIKRDVEYIGDQFQSLGKHTEVSLLKSQVGTPKKGDTITEDDGTTWSVTGRLKDDGAIVKVSVSPT